MTASSQPLAVRIAVAVLALCVGWLLIAPLYRMSLWIEQPNEGWNAIHALNAFTSALYPPRGSFIINNYPPLWFYLTGGLAKLGLDPIFSGRVIAFAAFVATAIGIALILRGLNASIVAAIVGGLGFMLILAGLLSAYVGLSEPQMVAHAFVTLGAAVLVRARGVRGAVVAAVLTALGILTKHVVIALPLASLIWLAMHRRHLLLPWLATGAAIGATAFAGIVLGYGQAFFANALFPRVLALTTLGKNLALIGKAIVPLLAFAAVAWRRRKDRDQALVFAGLAIAIAVLEIVVFGAARGVSINVVFDLVIAACIGLGLAWDRLPERQALAWRIMIVAALIVRVAIGTSYENVALPLDPGVRADMRRQSEMLLALRDALGNVSGPVACETLSVCVWAGQHNAVDLWKLRHEITLGPYMDTAALLRRMAEGEFGAVVLFGVPPVNDMKLPGLAAALSNGYPQPRVIGNSVSLFIPKSPR